MLGYGSSNINTDEENIESYEAQANSPSSTFCRGMMLTVLAAAAVAGGGFPAMVYLTNWTASTILATGLTATGGTLLTGTGLSLWKSGACEPGGACNNSPDLENPLSDETQSLTHT